MPFRTALAARGIEIFGLALVVLLAGLLGRGWTQRLLSVPAPVLWGVAGWGAAAALGAAVGWSRSNDPALLAGQLLGMGLLPLAIVAGLGLDARELWRGAAAGIAIATSIAAALHVGLWLWHVARGEDMSRMFLPNSVTPVGAAFLAAVLVPAVRAGLPQRTRLTAALGLGVICAFAIGTEVRSLWLAIAVGVVAWLVCERGWRAVFTRRTAAAALGTLAALGAILLGLRAWWAAPRPNLARLRAASTLGEPRDKARGQAAAPAPPDERTWTWSGATPNAERRLTDPFAAAGGGAYRIRARAAAAGDGQGFLDIVWTDRDGNPVGGTRAAVQPGHLAREVTAVGLAPRNASAGVVVATCSAGAAGPWSVERIVVERLRPRLLLGVLGVFESIGERLRALAFRAPAAADGTLSIDYRLEETAAVLRQFRSSRWFEMAFGLGLGARIHLGAFAVPYFDSESASYLHDFYLFALIKLGVIGLALVVGVLVGWTRWAWRAARTSAPGRERSFMAAVAGVWIGSAVWSVMTPTLISVPVTPLLGLLLAASAKLAQPGAAQG
ncbi:MAG TPA: hypothetical protein VED41_14030 [Solirubrobacteraceae bacterium]|nr:hypothetical protein [Solirubrobacteraceae bacterium]